MTLTRDFVRRLFVVLNPPRQWRVPVIIALGALLGVGGVILHIANATSYLSDNPDACMNCHVMAPQFATWQRGSHGRVTICNDCHVPHDNIFRKYAFKATDGLRHSTMFTFRMEPQVIHVKEAGINVIQENCVRCHFAVVQNSAALQVSGDAAAHGEGKYCWDCHRETPHGRVNSLASVPNAHVPELSSVMPAWMVDYLRQSAAKP